MKKFCLENMVKKETSSCTDLPITASAKLPCDMIKPFPLRELLPSTKTRFPPHLSATKFRMSGARKTRKGEDIENFCSAMQILSVCPLLLQTQKLFPLPQKDWRNLDSKNSLFL